MKEKIGILLFSVILLCSGCGQNEDKPNESSSLLEDVPAAAGSQVPYWAQGVEQDGRLFQGLNLDGVGDADDEVYINTYKFGDEYHSSWVTVLQVHLGTGEIMAELFPVIGYYDFKTGKIFSEDRDAIILGIQEYASNYNATHFWVLEVYPAEDDGGRHSSARMWVPLDTTAQPDGMSMNILRSSRGIVGNDGSTLMTRMPEVVDVEGSLLQGLKVTIYGSDEEGLNEWENIIYWKNGLWSDGNRTYKGKWEFVGEWMPVSE